MSKVSFSMVDRSREVARCGFHLPQITAANHDTVTGTNAVALKAAIATASLCNFANTKITHSDSPDVPSVPTNAFAQRETGLRVSYVDTVNPGKTYHTVIPGPDLDLFAQANTDEVDIVSNVAAQALISAIEANAVSELGNPIEVVRMTIIGRRA